MSLFKLVTVFVLLSSTAALADPPADKDHERKWTILASENYALNGNADKKPVSAPGVLVTAQRDPQNKR